MKHVKKIFVTLLTPALMLSSMLSSTITVLAATSEPREPVAVSAETPEIFDRSVKSEVVPLWEYWDRNFTDESIPEIYYFKEDVNAITFWAECENGAVDDTIILHIFDITHQGLYDSDIMFTADGKPYTATWFLPKNSEYKFWIMGDPNITKTVSCVTFCTQK